MTRKIAALAAAVLTAMVATQAGAQTATVTATFTSTAIPTPTQTGTVTRTFTSTAIPSPTGTSTRTATRVPTRTATLTFTPTNTPLIRVISIADAQLQEGNAGDRAFRFAVTLSAPSSEVVTVQWTTADGTAHEGSDYRPGDGLLTFAAGSTTAFVSVSVIGDTVNEPNETFFVNLFSPVHARLTKNQGRGTILNDDIGIPSVMPRDGSVEPGAAIALTLGWTHPERWRLLNTLDLRLRSGDQVVGWVRFTEAPNTFSAIDPTSQDEGPGFAPHSDAELASGAATISLHDSGWMESGANHEHVDVTWVFAFDDSAAGQIYDVEAAATDDDGFSQPFATIGTLAIGLVCAGDCGADGAVGIDELIRAVSIALGDLPLDSCLTADANRDESVDISDLITDVGHALTACPT